MSARPGYQELITKYGVDDADRIIDSAEHYSDAACKPWAEALWWAEDLYLNPPSPELAAQQARNAALHEEMVTRRGERESRPITYLVHRLPGDAFAYPTRLAWAEAMFEQEGGRLGEAPSLREAMDWAAEVAGEFQRTASDSVTSATETEN